MNKGCYNSSQISILHEEYIDRLVTIPKYGIFGGRILLETKNTFYILANSILKHIPKKNNIFKIYIGKNF